MAISQRTATKGTAASNAALTVTFPASSATGDFILLGVANAGTAGPATPAGWTLLSTTSAGSAQSISVFWAPWSAGLTGSFTNAASAAAWVCEAYIPDTNESIQIDASAATSLTTNNTTLPTGAPTSKASGDYEALFYAWTSGATISATAGGSTIDSTQANGTSVSCSLGHNNTTSIASGTTVTAFSQTLSASNTRKTGVGVLLSEGFSAALTAVAAATTVTAVAAGATLSASASLTAIDGPTVSINFAASASLITAVSSLLRGRVSWIELELPQATPGSITASAALSATASITTTQAVGASSALTATATLATVSAIGAGSTLTATAILSTAQGVGAAEANSATGSMATGQGVGAGDTLGATVSDSTAQGVAVAATPSAIAALVTVTAVSAGATLSAIAALTNIVAVGANEANSASASFGTGQGVGAADSLGATASLATTQGVGANASLAATGSESAGSGNIAGLSATATLTTAQVVAAPVALSGTALLATAQGVAANETMSASAGEQQNGGVAGTDVLAATATLATGQVVAIGVTLTATATTTTTQAVATTDALTANVVLQEQAGVGAGSTLAGIAGSSSSGSSGIFGDGAPSAVATIATAQAVAAGLSGAAIVAMDAEVPAPPPAPPAPAATIGGYPMSAGGGWTKQAGHYLDRIPLPARATADASLNELVAQASATIGYPTYIVATADIHLGEPVARSQAQYVPAPVVAAADAEVIFTTASRAEITPLAIVGTGVSDIPDATTGGLAQVWTPPVGTAISDQELPQLESPALAEASYAEVVFTGNAELSQPDIEAQAFGVISKRIVQVTHAVAVSIISFAQADVLAIDAVSTGLVWSIPDQVGVADATFEPLAGDGLSLASWPPEPSRVKLKAESRLAEITGQATGHVWPVMGVVGSADAALEVILQAGIGSAGAPPVYATGSSRTQAIVAFAVGEVSLPVLEPSKRAINDNDDLVALWLLGLVPSG